MGVERSAPAQRELHVEPHRRELAPRDRLTLIAALAPPTVWLAQLSLAGSLASWMCANGAEWPLRALTAAVLITCAWGGWHCWRHRAPEGPPPGGPRAETYARPTHDARRAVAWAGIAFAAFFTLLAFGVQIPGFILEPCS
jgi:hypothetical protein